MPQKAANAGLKAAFLSHRNHAAHATLICCAAPLGYPGESLTLSSRGPTSHRSAQDAVECASEREGHLPLLSLSQNCRTTGILGRMDAWRAWIGPPQGASDRSDHRPLPSPYPRPPQSPAIVDRCRSGAVPFLAGVLARGIFRPSRCGPSSEAAAHTGRWSGQC